MKSKKARGRVFVRVTKARLRRMQRVVATALAWDAVSRNNDATQEQEWAAQDRMHDALDAYLGKEPIK